MPHDVQHEAIAKFLIPDRPQEDNYPDPDEFEEKEKEWTEQQDWALARHAAWVEREQLVESRCVQEAAHAAVERTRLHHEVAKHKLKAATQKKVGAVVEVISCGKSVCARCSMKGLSICNLVCQLANGRPFMLHLAHTDFPQEITSTTAPTFF